MLKVSGLQLPHLVFIRCTKNRATLTSSRGCHLDEELLQRFDEGIRIVKRSGDGFLFGFGWQRDNKLLEIRNPIVLIVLPIAILSNSNLFD